MNFYNDLKTPPHKSQTVRGLQELQKLMATAVMRPLRQGDSMQIGSINGRATKKVAESFIKPSERQTSFERLEIYNRQYWFRLRKCLFTDYPGLRAVLGDEKFARLIDIYLTQNPSRSFTLRNLGSRLVEIDHGAALIGGGYGTARMGVYSSI
jgi:Putative DNA-binding domain